jgi:hypothetical protein
MSRRWIAFCLVAVISIGCRSRTTTPGPEKKDSELIGTKAIDIVGEDIDGKTFKLSDYQGKVVMLDFWGNW